MKPTSDAELRTQSFSDREDEWLADRAAVRALVEELPKCRCGNPGTLERDDGGGPYCEDEARRYAAEEGGDDHFYDLRYGPALRALLERLRGWDGEG